MDFWTDAVRQILLLVESLLKASLFIFSILHLLIPVFSATCLIENPAFR